MGFKEKILILTLLLFLMIGGVAAGDDNQTDDTLSVAEIESSEVVTTEIEDNVPVLGVSSTEDIEISEEINETEETEAVELDSAVSVLKASSNEVLGASNDEEVLGAGMGDLDEYLRNSGGYATLTDDYVSNGYFDRGPATVNYNLYVNGNGHVLDANNEGSIIEIYGSPNVIFENVTFKNTATYRLIFLSYHGGAIYIYGTPSVTFINCQFIDNSNNGAGGAIYDVSNGASVTLINCTFNGNTARNSYGGAIYTGSASTFTLTNCTFEGNDATYYGGAIYSADASSSFSLTDCTFKGNTANEGAAIYANTGNQFSITNCTFEANEADNYGGAIYNIASSCDVVNSTFNGNSAEQGGAIFARYQATELNVENSEFTGNTATNEGGAIYLNAINNVIIDSSDFTSNTGSDGAAIYAYSSNNADVSGTFEDNYATGRGGSIYWTDSSNLNIHDVTVDGSTSNSEGGAFYLNSVDTTIENAEFTKTTANNARGGAIYSNDDIVIKDSSFSDFYSNGDAAAIFFDEGTATLNNSAFNGNNAVLVNTNAIAYLNENTITDSDTSEGYAVSNKGTLYLNQNSFDDVISNSGDIETQTYTVILNNQTVYISGTDDVILTARIVDDNDNDIVTSGSLEFSDTDFGLTFTGSYSQRAYRAAYYTPEKGTHIINAAEEQEGLNNHSIKTGTLIVENKEYTSIEFNITQVNEGETVTIVAKINPEDDANPYDGNVTFKVGNDVHIINVENGKATLVLNNLSADTYALTATYSGDENHFNSTNNTYFIVKLRKTQISIVVDNILYGQNATAIATTNANGTVVFIFNGRKEVEIINGNATWNITNLEPGDYSITVVYPGNEYYESAYNYTTFTVYKNNAEIESIDFARVVAYGANNTITVTMGNITTGELIIEVNGQNYTVQIVNKIAKLNVSLPIGKDYTVKAYFTGDNHFNATSKAADYTFEVTGKNVTIINITVEKVVEIDTENVNVTFKTNSDADLIVLVNDVNQTVNKAGDTYWFIADTSAAGTYTISAMTNETGNYSAGYNITTFTVIKHNSTVSIDVGEEFAVGTDFTITVTSNSTVNVTINGKTYTVGADGKVNIDTTALKAGEYIVIATVYENDKYYGNTTNKTFTVTKHDAVIESVDVTPTTQIGQNITVTVTMGNVTEGSLIIEADGLNYSVPIVNGEAVLSFTTTKIGDDFPVNVYYLGDESYNEANSTGYSFNVTGKYNTTIEIVASDIIVDGILNVTVKTNSSAPMTVQVNGENQTLSKTGDTYWFIADTSAAGNFTVTAMTDEVDYYYAGYNSTTFDVFKHNSTVSIDVNEVNYVGDTFTITVTSNATTNVTINGKTYAVKADGTVDIATADLAAGEYTVIATVYENAKYYGNTTSAVFNIIKYNSEIASIVVSPQTTQIGQDITVTVTMANVTEGTVVIEVNGANYTADITDSVATLTLTTTEIGNNFPVKVYFLGDYKYNASSKAGNTFNVTGKYNTEIIITATDVLIDGKLNVTIKTNTTAPITVKVNDAAQEVTKTGDVYWFIADTSAAGNYTVIASSEETEFYYAGHNSTTFNVYKLNSTVAIDVDTPHYVGDSFTITVTNNTAVNVTVNGKTYAVKADGTVDIDTTVLAAGEYTVTAVIYENDKYYGNSTTATFEIVKYNAEIESIDFAPVVGVGYNNTITVTMANVTEGSLIIEVDGVNYTVAIADKVAKLNVSLPVGEDYTVKAYFAGDDRYNATEMDGGSFDVTDKNVTVIAIEVAEVVVIDSENVIVTVTTNSSAPITVQVNGVNQTLTAVDEHTVSFTADTSAAGTYTITAMTAENADYAAGYNVTTFKVIKHNSTVAIDVDPVHYVGDTFTITVTSNATANVTVNGKTYAVKADGTVDIDTVDLAAGEYTVTATVYESDKYYGNSTTATFEIVKYNSEIASIEFAPVVGVGYNNTITVTMANVTEGSLIIEVDGVNYTVNIADKVAKLNVSLPVGEDYAVKAYFLGDDKYNATEMDGGSFNVTDKNVTVITIDVVDVVVIDSENVIVTVTTNSTAPITVQVNGVNQTLAAVDGHYEFTADTSAAGTYTITAMTAENEDYVAGYNVTTYKVIKHNSTVEIEVGEEYTVGSEFIIKVSTNATANVTINGKTYAVNDDGTVDVDTTVLAAGNYTVVATVYESDKYYGNVTSASFTIYKLSSQVNVTGDIINVGENATVSVTVTEGATGYAVVYVNGQNYTVNLTGSKGSVIIEGLKNTTYPVTVTYLGDDKYSSSSNSTAEIAVNKVESNIAVKVDNITVGDVAVINITVTDGATGNVTVKIGNEYETTVGVVGGTFSITVPGLSVGNKTVNVTYNGDDKYLSSTASAAFSVAKATVDVKVIAQNITYGDTETVTVFVNATGNVTIELNGNVIASEVAIDNGKVVYPIADLAAGNYTVKVTYNGNGDGEASTAEANFTVKKALPSVDVAVTDITYGEVETITVNVNTNGNVTIKVNGKEKEIILVNGIASLDVSDLAAGKYPVEVTYNGNENYTALSSTVSFNVAKAATSVDLEIEPDITVGQTQVINITVNNTNASGQVIVSIDGENYTVDLTNGFANFTVPALNSGNHTVTVVYEGNANLTGNWTSAIFTVSKHTAVIDSVIVPVTNTTAGFPVEIVVNMANVTDGSVVVEVGGHNYTVNISDKTAKLSVVLPAGDYTATAYYLGDENYTGATKANSTVFHVVNKTVSEVNITAESVIEIDSNITFTVNTNSNSTLVVKVNGVVVSAGADGKYTFNAAVAGNYTITAEVAENDYYTAAFNSTMFAVIKHNSTVAVTVDSLHYVNDTFTITVTNNTAVNVTINGKAYAVKADGTVDIDTAQLAAGEYIVTATITENDKYYGNATNKTFVISKLASNVTVTADEVVYGNDAVIVVTVPTEETGYVTVTVNGHNYTAKISEGQAKINVSGLDVGSYDVNVTYSGDAKFNESANVTSFEVVKANLTANVTALNVTVKENSTFIITNVNSDFEGKVQITVDGETYDGNLESIIEMAKLTEGNKTATVTFYGDGNYNDKTLNVNFTVSKVDVESTISATDLGNGTVVVTVGDNATGNVTIKVGDNEYTAELVNGTASIDLVNETPGRYNITVEYSGDADHNAASVNSTATIPKYDTPISVNVTDISVGETAVINVTVPSNATGSIRVTIDGINYTEVISAGQAIFEVENLTAGLKTVTVEYIGDENYTANHTTETFTVEKITPTITVAAEDASVGEAVIINVTAPDDVQWPVLVDIAGSSYYVNITDGKGQLVLNNLLSGDYSITVSYLGDDKYLNATNTTDVTVSKVASAVEVASDNITVGEVAVVEITVPDDATGNVTVTVGGETYTAYVANGKATVLVRNLEVGNYTVEVTYNGDDKYLSNSNVTAFSVIKDNVTCVKVIDQLNGTVVVVVGDNATGNVTVKVGDNEYTAEVVNGTASVDLVNEAPGEHNITVIYSGDKNHNGETVNATATIPKYDAPISVNISDIKVGEIAYVNVTLPDNATGNVTVTIDGVEYSASITEGVAKFEIENLTAGLKTVTIEYIGDENYTSNYTTETFAVEKITPAITVAAEDADVGEGVVINVTAPSDVQWPVLVDVDGVGYYVNITDGKGQLTVNDLLSGDYTVTVRYLGDDKYMNATNASEFTVSKVNSSVIVSADNITVGDVAVIEITVPEDASGNVTVTVGGETYTVYVANGKGTLTVKDLKVGNYTVEVTYNGDDKYNANANSTEFEVIKAEVNDITVVDQGNGTVVVVVGDNTTGNVTVKVGDNEYTAEVINGTAIVDLVNETPGEHNITVTYSGDENHSGATVNATATIPKLETPISIVVENSYVGTVNEIVVTLPENATGSVTIEIDGVNYTETIDSTGKATFEVYDLTAGNKTVVAIYAGDDSYVANSTTARFAVEKLESEITVTAEVLDKTALITVSVLPADATGIVVVTVDGTDYAVNLSSTNQVTVPISKSGTYDVTAVYSGDDKYLGSSNATSFKATIDDEVTIEVQNETYGETVTVKVTVPDDATGNVTVKLGNDTEVTVPVTGGENVITIDNVSQGTYDINVTYSGDDKYASKTVLDTVSVYSSINAENMKRGWNSSYDYKAEFLDSQGRVLNNTDIQYTVNGNTYTVKTDFQGIAYLSVPLAVGTYEITSINPVTGEKVTKNLTIVKRLLENKDITMDFVDGTYYIVLAIGDDGEPVGEGEFIDIYVNTIHYSCRTDKDGYARLKINLNPNTYTVRSEYKLTEVKNKLVVKQTLKLVKKTIKVKKGKKFVIKAKLKWSNGKAIKGKVIKFKFKGKTYKAKTNSKGIAKVTIKAKITKKLKKGKKYKYSATYLTNTVKGKVKIK